MNKLIKPYEFQAYYIPNIFTFPIITAALLQVHKKSFLINEKGIKCFNQQGLIQRNIIRQETYIYVKE